MAQPGGTILGIDKELRESPVAGWPDLLARVDLLADPGTELVARELKSAHSRRNRDRAEESAGQLLWCSELVQKLDP